MKLHTHSDGSLDLLDTESSSYRLDASIERGDEPNYKSLLQATLDKTEDTAKVFYPYGQSTVRIWLPKKE